MSSTDAKRNRLSIAAAALFLALFAAYEIVAQITVGVAFEGTTVRVPLTWGQEDDGSLMHLQIRGMEWLTGIEDQIWIRRFAPNSKDKGEARRRWFRLYGVTDDDYAAATSNAILYSAGTAKCVMPRKRAKAKFYMIACLTAGSQYEVTFSGREASKAAFDKIVKQVAAIADDESTTVSPAKNAT